MHAALLNSSFFTLIHSSLPSFPLSLSLCVNSFLLHYHAVSFSRKCKTTEIFTFLVDGLKILGLWETVYKCDSDRHRQLSELGHWAEKKPISEYCVTAFCPKLGPDTEEGGTAGLKLRHTCPEAWPEGIRDKGFVLQRYMETAQCLLSLKGAINRICSFSQCFISPLLDCAEVWLDHSHSLCLAGYCLS